MKQEYYESLGLDLSKYYNNNIIELNESGKAWIKMMVNSSYGSYSVNLIKSRYLETINEKRSKKIKKLLDGI